MNTRPSPAIARSMRARQRGAVSVALAALLLFLLGAAVVASLQLGGSAVQDSRTSDEQAAALFLAESGLERAQGVIAANMDDFDNAAAYCTGLADSTDYALGRGTVRVLSAQASPQPCTAGVPTGSCCTLLVAGQVQAQQRLLQGRITTEFKQGVEGYGSTTSPALVMETQQDGAAAFTNLAYRAKDPVDQLANAHVGGCSNTGGICRIGDDYADPDGWDLPRTGTNNVSSSAVYAAVPVKGDYTIDVRFANNARRPASRNYVQTGILLYPPPGSSVSFLGHFASANDSSSTSSASGTVGTWTCGRASSTTSQWARAGGSDTLVYGFASWPSQTVTRLAGVKLGPQSFSRVVNLVGTRGDNLYSQIWYAYNPAYLPVTAQPVATDATKYYNPAGTTAPGLATARSGEAFTGIAGAAFTGRATASELVLESALGTSERLDAGDQLYQGSTLLGTVGALIDGTAGQTGARYAYTGSTAATGSALLTRSRVLQVSAEPANGALSDGDTVQTTAGAVTLGTLQAVAGASGALRFRLSTPQRVALASGNLRSLNIVVLEATTVMGPWTRDLTGTALAVHDPATGAGRLLGADIQGSISGQQLTVSTAGATLHPGDALSGSGVKPMTRVTRVVDAAAGLYEVCSGPSGSPCQQQEVGSTTTPVALVARPAIKPNHSTASLNSSLTTGSFSVSRPPSVPLAGARLCGGLCALMHDATTGNRASGFALSGITAGDDWSSGFSCLSGVDPFRLRVLGSLVVKRVAWAEVIR